MDKGKGKIQQLIFYLPIPFIILMLFLGIIWMSGPENASALEYQSATTYYVSPSGDDNNPGTSQSEAWKTIAKVNSMSFIPGDSILFERGGVWNETLVISSSGFEENPIVFGTYGSGEKPTIDGSGFLSRCIASDNQSDYIVIDSLYLMRCGDPDTPAQSPDFDEWHGCLVSSQNDGWTVRNNTIEDCGQRAIFARGDPIGPIAAKDWIIEDNLIGTIIFNEGSTSDRTAILLRGLDHPIVRRNIITPINTAAIGTNTGGQSHTGAESSYPEFYENEVTNAIGCNLYAMWTDYAQIHHNYVHDSHGAGICVSYDSDYAEIFYNIIHDMGNSSGFYNGIDINLDADYGKIFNNVVVNVAYVNITIEDASWDPEIQENMPSDGWIIRNNILDARGNSPAEVPIAIYPTCKDTVISNNVYIPNASFWGGGFVGRWKGEYLKFEYDEWSNASGDTLSMVIDPDSDPLFVEGANHDYHLTSDSVALDQGYDVGLDRDFEGNLVPQGNAPDIGAYEYGTSPYAKEDIDQNGKVDALDVQHGINAFLGKEPDPTIVQRADVNGDGVINDSDLKNITIFIFGH